MNKYIKTAFLFAAFVLLIGGSFYLYQRFGRNYRPGPPAPTQKAVSETAGPDQTADPDASSPEAETEKTYPAPDFSVQDADGNMISLSSLTGKPIVINFWASWCGYCKSEMPEFQKVYEDLSDDVTFMMVNVTDGSQETLKKAAAYLEDKGFTFPVYYDVNLEATYAYQAYSLPTTYFIDAEGNIVTGAAGAMDEETLRSYIDMLIDG